MEKEDSSDSTERSLQHGRGLGHGRDGTRCSKPVNRCDGTVTDRRSDRCGDAALSCFLSGEDDAGRRQWVGGPPNTLLNALAQAELTSSTLDTLTAGRSSHTHTHTQGQLLEPELMLTLCPQTQSEAEQRRKRSTLTWRWMKSAGSRGQTTMTRESTHWTILTITADFMS